MSLNLAEKDAAVILGEALAIYKSVTGVTLAPADPRRLHLQALLLHLAQHRSLIDFAGKQSMIRYVSALWIAELARLWGEDYLPAQPSTCTVRFSFPPSSGVHTVPAGKRVTDGTNTWAVTADATGIGDIDTGVTCTVVGDDSNAVAIGQIDTLVDPLPDCTGVSNLTETAGGSDIETTEAFRTRLRSVPESRSTCGPRLAYEAHALAASGSCVGAVALGPEDAAEMAGTPPDPGEVFVLVIEGTKDTAGNIESVIPEPSAGLLTTVEAAVTGEEVRPLTDFVTVKAPEFVDYDIDVTYYIGRSRSDFATAIQAAVEANLAAHELTQQAIGRDINPSELHAIVVAAQAKRAVVTLPAFASLMRDECPRLRYYTVTFGGLEDD